MIRVSTTLRLFGLSVLAACAPSIHANSIHPDADEQVSFPAGKGNVKGTITQMQTRVGGAIVVTKPGLPLSVVEDAWQAGARRVVERSLAAAERIQRAARLDDKPLAKLRTHLRSA